MTRTGTGPRTGRVREAAGTLGVRVVLLAFWGTAAVLARWCGPPRKDGAESVRHKA
ncbi:MULTISPECIES: hypothetical protein [unclassified Streptomyces]|uniref:hypothetical protein n=1 Tax=unclassified Streptomyces TaxID=2593676 RepID=UPI002E165A64